MSKFNWRLGLNLGIQGFIPIGIAAFCFYYMPSNATGKVREKVEKEKEKQNRIVMTLQNPTKVNLPRTSLKEAAPQAISEERRKEGKYNVLGYVDHQKRYTDMREKTNEERQRIAEEYYKKQYEETKKKQEAERMKDKSS